MNAMLNPDADVVRSAVPPKSSALRVATLRAIHQLYDRPLVFDDPLALKILGPDEEQVLRAGPDQYDSPLFRGLRTSVVVRSRLAEDEWSRAYRRGVLQYVILGAGLDTYAFRSREADGSRIFEVDLPTTQRWKRERLRAAGIGEPAELTFVAIDFEHATLLEELNLASFNPMEPAFFSWLGVTMYLAEDSILSTLRQISSLPAGSGVVFDYATAPALLSPREQGALEALTRRAAAHDEPWKTFFWPDELTHKLHSLGFHEVVNYGPEQLNELYLSERTDGLHKSGVSRLVCARL